jgi:pyrroloquinoline quinone (PQQ) biosynthesis protein C
MKDEVRLRLTRRLVELVGGPDAIRRAIEGIKKRSAKVTKSREHQSLVSLVGELQRDALKHPLLDSARFAALEHEDVVVFAEQCYEFVRCFPLYLGGLLAHIPDTEIDTLMVLTDNLVDECGGYDRLEDGDTRDAHPRLFRRFLVRLGLVSDPSETPERPKEIFPGTQEFVEEYFRLCDSEHFSLALGAFGPGNECFAKKWVPILAGLRKNEAEFTEEDLIFFSVHSPAPEAEQTSVEDEHGNLMLLLLAERLEGQPESMKAVRAGAKAAVDARLAFFEGVHRGLRHQA